MYSNFKEHMERLGTKVNEQLWQEIQNHSKVIRLKKNEILVRHGTINKHSYFVDSGSLLVSIILKDGRRRAIWFHFHNQFKMLICPDSYFSDEPTVYEIRALDNATVIRFNKYKVDEWTASYPIVNQVYVHDLINLFTAVSEIRAYKLGHSPIEFWTYLNQRYPEIINQIPAKHVASFIGISPEWYSKLMKRYLQKGPSRQRKMR